MQEAELTEILREHSGALSDKRRFAGFMKDLFPGQMRETNLLLALFDMGLPGEIENTAQITNAFAYRFVKRLTDEHGISRTNADWAVSMWCVCYGKNIWGKPCEIKINATKSGGEPTIHEEKPGKTQYQDLFTYAKNPDASGYVITGFTGDNLKMIICPNKYNNEPVTAIAAGAFSESNVEEAVLTEGLISIGERAFGDCARLKQVIFTDSLKEIGDYTFSGCGALVTAMLPVGLERIGRYAFSSTGLKSVGIPGTVYWLGAGTYSRCGNIGTITIPESVLVLPDKLFEGCVSLKKIILHDRLESIGEHAFADCAGLMDVTIPDSVKQIGDGAFAGTNVKFLLLCGRGSFTESFARKNNLRFQFV